jgi:ribosomal protein S18 acetylase RimI-like enzyme
VKQEDAPVIVRKNDCSGIDWRCVAETLARVGMAHFAPEVHRKAFAASYATVFVLEAERIVGFGRALSDGAYQAAIYDVAVVPESQGRGVGRLIVENLLDGLAGCNVILYAAPGKEDFYRRLGFRRMRTGMARFARAGPWR